MNSHLFSVSPCLCENLVNSSYNFILAHNRSLSKITLNAI